MGLFDDVQEAFSDVDLSEDHLWGHGFEKRACYGDAVGVPECPHLKSGKVDTCGRCGCPITNLSMAGAPPASCPDERLEMHADD
jgi:hypothetical protein